MKEWFVYLQNDVLGPFTTEQVHDKIRRNQFSALQYAWRVGTPESWTRLCEFDEMHTLLPEAPPRSKISTLGDRSNKVPHAPIVLDFGPPSQSADSGSPRAPQQMGPWYLQFEGSEFGPMSLAEVKAVLKNGKLKGTLFAWREGMTDWAPIQQFPELLASLESDAGTPKRRTRRVNIVAAVSFTMVGDSRKDAPRFTGICGNLSPSGLLILSSTAPGTLGGLVHLTVRPSQESGVPPFDVEAKVVRFLPGIRGFGVEFLDVPKRVGELLKESSRVQKM